MLFIICEHLRSGIADINEQVLNKYQKIVEAKEEQDRIESMPSITNVDHHTFTAVTKESFKIWCENWMAERKMEEENTKTEQDLRKTGRELFLESGTHDFLTLEDVENVQVEEEKEMEDKGDQGPIYDKNLFADDFGDDDDVDFD